MIALISATENAWWEHYIFEIGDKRAVVYYQKPHDSYQYPEMGVDKDIMQTIIAKLKELRSTQLVTTP